MKTPATAVLPSLGCFQPTQDCLASATSKEKMKGERNETASADEGTASLRCIYLLRKIMLDAVITPVILRWTHWGPPIPCLWFTVGFLLCPV